MKASLDCIELIKSFEGFSSYSYLCPAGIPTIGYGSTHYENGSAVALGDRPVDRFRADRIIAATLEREYEPGVNHAVRVKLTQGQYDALVDFAYNLGVRALRTSTLLKKLNAGDFDGASREFGKWTRCDGKILPGLVARREAERKLFCGETE